MLQTEAEQSSQAISYFKNCKSWIVIFPLLIEIVPFFFQII